MVISTFGKKFLKKYNEENGTNLSSKEFFYDVFYPIILGHSKLGILINNSPFYQNFIVGLSQLEKRNQLTEENIKEYMEISLEKFNEKIENKEFDGCMYVGWGSDKKDATTSGQITNIKFDIDENEVYFSWIAHALSLNINSYSILINDDQILYDIFLGWERYRELVNDPVLKIRAYELPSWNTYWIDNYYDERGEDDRFFNPYSKHSKEDKNGNVNLISMKWIDIVYRFCANKNPNHMWYVYKLSKSNETYGYISIITKEISSFMSMCEDYFGKNDFLDNKTKFTELFGSSYGFSGVCELGCAGFKEIKPYVLSLESRSDETSKKNKKNEYKKIKNDPYYFKLYKLYIMATLNIKDLEEKTNQLINLLYQIETEKIVKSTGRKSVEVFLQSNNIRQYSDGLTELIKACKKMNIDHAIIKEFWNMGHEEKNHLPELMANIRFLYEYSKP